MHPQKKPPIDSFKDSATLGTKIDSANYSTPLINTERLLVKFMVLPDAASETMCFILFVCRSRINSYEIQSY